MVCKSAHQLSGVALAGLLMLLCLEQQCISLVLLEMANVLVVHSMKLPLWRYQNPKENTNE
jgi:hypothetical protein